MAVAIALLCAYYAPALRGIRVSMRASRHLLWPPPPPRRKQAVQRTTVGGHSGYSAPLGRRGNPRRACRRLLGRCAPAPPEGGRTRGSDLLACVPPAASAYP